MPDITIEPGAKYREVIEHEWPGDGVPDTGEEFIEESEHFETAEAFSEKMATSPVPDDPDEVRDGPISWDDISVSQDPDLVAKMATYFDGMDPDEPTDELQAKLRLLDVEVYANAQIAAQEELRS